MKKTLGVLLGLVLSTSAMADFMPENDLHLLDNVKDASMTEARFNELIDIVTAVYEPIISAKGARLVVNRKWSSSTVNASASQSGSTWYLNMYGGLARHSDVTEDGFSLVVCHEFGHHLGGFPFVQSWAADEGQSDYFATQSCGRNIWANDVEANAAAAETVDATAKAQCDEAWESDNDKNLCYRMMNASYSLATLLSGGRGVNFDTPDTSVVSSTNHRHPAAQCRLDTYVVGALCAKEFNRELIPGKSFGNRNGEDAEFESASVLCTRYNQDPVGSRSQCWFKPGI
jgi:hypothetical protein